MENDHKQKIRDILAEARVLEVGVVLHIALETDVPRAAEGRCHTTLRPGIHPGDSKRWYLG